MPLTRLKLPAYGAALRELRRTGTHPLCVHLIFGFHWRAPCVCFWQNVVKGAHPLLALKPSDYAPGLYDFSIVTALQVCVFDQEGAADPLDDVDRGPQRPWWCGAFYRLLGELAAFAADVEVYSPRVFGSERRSAYELAWEASRRVSPRGWPCWWSHSIEVANAKRRDTWARHVFDPERALAAA